MASNTQEGTPDTNTKGRRSRSRDRHHVEVRSMRNEVKELNGHDRSRRLPQSFDRRRDSQEDKERDSRNARKAEAESSNSRDSKRGGKDTNNDMHGNGGGDRITEKHSRDEISRQRTDRHIATDLEKASKRPRTGTTDVLSPPRIAFVKPEDDQAAEEAARIARIAAKAEMKAAARSGKTLQGSGPVDLEAMARQKKNEELDESSKKVAFLTKEERAKLALQRLEDKKKEAELRRKEMEEKRQQFLRQNAAQSVSSSSFTSSGHGTRSDRDRERERGVSRKDKDRSRQQAEHQDDEALERKALKEQYLGKKVAKKKVIKPSEKFAKIFQFDWEADEDTSKDLNPIYKHRMEANLLFGRGYRAGIDPREQRKQNTFLESLTLKRQDEARKEDSISMTEEEQKERERERRKQIEAVRKQEDEIRSAMAEKEAKTMGKHWSEKSLEQMTERDWRILKEDFDIQVRGGKAPNPLRFWEEAGLPDSILKAIYEMKYIKPSPIQRQCIPIGSQHRDIIGIAETGSGKTAAFTIPMLMYIQSRPVSQLDRVAEEGPLAVVMAPTRELALQIEAEILKISKFIVVGSGETNIKTVSVVGGQDIQLQGFKLRKGVEIVIGTPGRLVDTLEMRYLVLNQASYVVLDEADRMIDMGFEGQVEEVLDAMGGLLKSVNEEELEQQIQLAHTGAGNYRVTAMFSATMPPQVERLAKTYLRHPAIVRIGDEQSGKNKRIRQVLMWTTESKKMSVLTSLLQESQAREDKIIVFVNKKKQCDVVVRALGNLGYNAAILHGGKTQDQREEALDGFRSGRYDLLVGTDVLGRGLDIPDVTHVINYDLPAKIEPYTHRIGRTGRAGKEGLATSLITDMDDEIMYDLKQYLQATNMPIPPQLNSHPASKQSKTQSGGQGKSGSASGSSKGPSTAKYL